MCYRFSAAHYVQHLYLRYYPQHFLKIQFDFQLTLYFVYHMSLTDSQRFQTFKHEYGNGRTQFFDSAEPANLLWLKKTGWLMDRMASRPTTHSPTARHLQKLLLPSGNAA